MTCSWKELLTKVVWGRAWIKPKEPRKTVAASNHPCQVQWSIIVNSIHFFCALPWALRWKDSSIFDELIAKMGTAEAKRRRYIWI